MATSKRPVQKAEMLNEVVIAEIREIFTLFDKNADGYVTTSDLGTMIRGLGFNPTEREVAEMQKDVDPNQSGSFDQNSLISLIARRPKQNDTLEDMIESLKILSTDPSTSEE
jgi:calmodulin